VLFNHAAYQRVEIVIAASWVARPTLVQRSGPAGLRDVDPAIEWPCSSSQSSRSACTVKDLKDPPRQLAGRPRRGPPDSRARDQSFYVSNGLAHLRSGTAPMNSKPGPITAVSYSRAASTNLYAMPNSVVAPLSNSR